MLTPGLAYSKEFPILRSGEWLSGIGDVDAVELIGLGRIQIGDRHLTAIGRRAGKTGQLRPNAAGEIDTELRDIGSAQSQRSKEQVILGRLVWYAGDIENKHLSRIDGTQSGDVLEQVVLAGAIGILIGQRIVSALACW